MIYVLDNQGNAPVTELEEEDIEEFLFYCKKHGNNSARMKRRMSTISALYRYLRKKKIIKENPMEFIDRPTKDVAVVKQTYLTPDEVKLMREKLNALVESATTVHMKDNELNTAKFRTFVRAQLEEANAANDGGKSAGEMKKILDWLNSSVDSETISFEQLTDAIKGYGTAMADAKEKTDAIKSAFSGLYDIQQKIKNSQFGVGDLDATESKIESILQLSKFFGDNKDLMDNLVDKNGNINLNTEAFKKATLDELDKRIKAANETGGAAATALANSLSSDKENIESGKISVSDYLVGLGTDLKRVNTELDKYQANWNTLKDAMDEWNTTGQLTQDTMQKLQELPEEFSNLLTYDEDGNAKIDVKALRQSYVDKLSAFAKEFEGSPIGIQVQAMIDDVREPTHDEYVELAKKTATYQKVLAQYTKKMSAIDSNKDLSEDEALQQKAEVQKELDDALEKALLEVQETDAQVTTKLKKHWDGVEKVIEEFKSALSDAKAVLSSFLSLLSTLNDNSNNDLKIWGDAMGKVIDKRIEALNKQKEALEENNEATERAIELSKAQDAHSSGVVVVCSSHDFQKTPDKNELISRMVKMQQVGADLPKVAVMPHDSTDVLTLLAATVEMKNKYFATPIITISMSKLGVASRLCGEVFGSAMTFASVGDSSAPGQIGLDVINAVLDSIAE